MSRLPQSRYITGMDQRMTKKDIYRHVGESLSDYVRRYQDRFSDGEFYLMLLREIEEDEITRKEELDRAHRGEEDW